MSYTNDEGWTFDLKTEEVIPFFLKQRETVPPPIYAYIGEVSYGGNLFGVVEDFGPFRHLEEITDTDEYFPDRYTIAKGFVIPWTIENGRELAIAGQGRPNIGALIDYCVEDRDFVWQGLNLEKGERLAEILRKGPRLACVGEKIWVQQQRIEEGGEGA